MLDFLLLLFIFCNSFSSKQKSSTWTSLTHSNEITKSSPKSANEYICTSTTEISDQTFNNFATIKSDAGCQSIKITNCVFDTINSENIILAKNNELYIEKCHFLECKFSNSIINGMNNDVLIENCIFSNNGFDNSESLILLENANNVHFSFTSFENSQQRKSSALQSSNTKNISLTFCTFKQMMGKIDKNGGAISVQFSENVSLSNCIFDSNYLQKSNENINEIRGSAFFINLNNSFICVNNTIENHENFLNSVVTFNMKDIKSLNEVVIKSSSFINNKYSKSIDGSGIGFLAENVDDSDQLIIAFIECLFEKNGDSTTNEIASSAGVFGLSKKLTSLSFIDCYFDSNLVPSSSSLINVQNGYSLSFENCSIKENVGYCLIKFSPLTIEDGKTLNINEIQVQIINLSITGLTNRVSNDIILIENDTKFNSSLILDNCAFSDVSLNTNNYVIHTKSNLHTMRIYNSKISNNDLSKGSNIMKFENSDINFLNIKNCIFEKNYYVISSEITIKEAVISNCTFTDCVSDTSNFATIKIKSENFLCENCDLVFTSHSNSACSMGIFISESITAIINNVNFKYCLGLQEGCAIRCISQNIQSTSLTVKSCNFDDCTQQMSNVYTTNRELNFINNTIASENVNNNLKGLLINYMCRLFIDKCTFTHCSYNSDSKSSGSSIRYNPSTYDESIDESIIIQNCHFTECIGYGAVAGLNPFVSRPKFYNITILKSYHNFNIIIVMQSSTSTKAKEPNEVLLQNVSFIDCHPKGNNAGVGGGGCGFWYQTAISTEDTVSFIDCRFEDNNYHGTDVTKYGGGAISIQSSSWSHFYVKISSCSFYNCYTSANNGGAVAINTTKSVQIEDSYFENCRIENTEFFNYKGGAIYINQIDEMNPFYIFNTTFNNTISCSDYSAIGFDCYDCNEFIIIDCSFLNCITRCYQNLPYNILSCPSTVKQFSCIDTNFVFDEKSTMNPRVAKIESPIFSFNNCQFIKCGSKLIDKGGALFYDGTYSNEDVSISDCNFDECHAIDSSSFKFKFNSNVYPTFRNITFSNTNSDYNIYITYKVDFRGTIQLERLRFINNTNYSEGGGSGIWISNFQNSYNSYPIRLYFSYCEFINNYTPLNGGGYGVGVNEAIEPTQLSFTSCHFIGNHCNGTDGGGALWIRTSLSCTISSCTFKNNYASELCQSNGGALYLSFTSNMIFMTLNSCVFDNNTCPYLNSKGHAIYSTLLYGRMEVSYSNLTDNGNGVDYPNSVIYSRSELNVINSQIAFSDKEKAFSRAIFVGGSSDLMLRGCVIVNCSINEIGGASLYYESIRNKDSGVIEIIENTFINNTSKEKGFELHLIINNSPRVLNYNCTFINESAECELIYIQFIHQSIYSERYDRFYFINCDFNYKHFISKDQDEILNESLVLLNCRYISCTNIPLFFTDFYSVQLTSCVFEGNTNDNRFITIDNIEEKSIIEDCEFRNNVLSGNSLDENNEFSLINATHISLTIINTVFERTIQKETPKYTVFYSPSKNEQSCFYMNNCNINNNGIVFINDWTKEISVINTSFSNSVNGLYYSTESNFNDYVSDVFQIDSVVFDNFSNCACLLSASNDINISNTTIKNCQNIEEYCVSIFQIDMKNDLINYFTFSNFTFENNRFNNNNNNNWMNGGGIGLLINLSEKHKEIFLNFIDCNFISNHAEDYGGGFAFIESNERTTFLNFDSCYFNGNSCNKHEGSALYLIVKNVSISNCIFDQKSDITEREVGSIVYIQSIPMNGLSIPLSLHNCSFINNNECSLNIYNSLSELFILDCLFTNDKEYSSEDINNKPLYINVEECQKDVIISDSTFETYKKKNKDINLIYSKTNSVTIKNNIFKGNENENDYAISSCCSNIILIENNEIFDSGGIYIFPDSNIITLTKTIINNTNYGLFFKPNNILHSITITECTFSSIMHALLLKLIKNDSFILKNNTICNCNNFDEKTSIIEITINAFINLQFEEFIFYNNQYSQPQTKPTGFGGGIGLNIFSTNKLQECKLEFKNCIFSSNSVNQKEGSNDYNSGGSLYYVNDNNITLSELSINACNFTKNYAKQKGGSLYIKTGNKSPVYIKNCCFILNKAEIDCGAVYIKNEAEFKMDSSQFINNSVSSTLSSMIPADSLYILSNANAIVSNSIFVKLSFPNEITNVQTMFSISNRYTNQEISILVKDSLYSVINPSKSIVVLQNPNQKGIITIDNVSFTHFFINNESSTKTAINKMNEAVPQENENIEYIHVFITNDLLGKINFDNSCFDTESIYSNDYQIVGLNNDDKEINNELISTKNNKIDNYECERPLIVDELIDQIFLTKPPTPPNKLNLKLLIGLIVGIFSLISIIVIIVLIYVIKKKKKKEEEEEKTRKEREKEKEMTMELDAIQNKYGYTTQPITQENPLFTFANVINNELSEDEETEKIQTTKG